MAAALRSRRQGRFYEAEAGKQEAEALNAGRRSNRLAGVRGRGVADCQGWPSGFSYALTSPTGISPLNIIGHPLEPLRQVQ